MRTEQGVSLGKRIQYGAGGEWTVGWGGGGRFTNDYLHGNQRWNRWSHLILKGGEREVILWGCLRRNLIDERLEGVSSDGEGEEAGF